MQTTIVFNPEAGRLRRDKRALSRAVAVLRKHGDDVELRPTPGPGTAGDVVRQAIAGGTERVLVAGGDGTLNEALGGLIGSEIPLGLLPAGTANVLATECGLGRNPQEGAERLVTCEAVPISVGRLETAAGTRHFLCMAGVGLDAAIVRRVSPEVKRRLGKLSYWVGGFGMLGRRLPEFEVRMNGTIARASYALFSRVRNYGGDLEIARHAELRDDRMGVVLFAGGSSIPYLKYFGGVLLNRLDGMTGVTVAHATEAEIPDVAPIQVDGEDAGDGPARIGLEAGAIRVLLPRRGG